MPKLNTCKRNNPYLLLNKSEYYDYCINHDEITSNKINYGEDVNEDYLISDINFSSINFIGGDKKWIYSNSGHNYSYSIARENILFNAGYTFLDNGAISFKKDRISNSDFFDLFTKTQYKIEEKDYRLKLHTITGSTGQFIYPIEYKNNFIHLNGGFLQGFFETEKDKYKILPDEICDNSEWNIDFFLRRDNSSVIEKNTLNEKYPENKGIFFYIGTRAENKWTLLYNEVKDSGTTISYLENSGYTEFNDYFQQEIIDGYSHLNNYFLDDIDKPCSNGMKFPSNDYSIDYMDSCEFSNNLKYFSDINNGYMGADINLNDYNYLTKYNYELTKTGYYEIVTDNGFLIYDRSKSGYTVNTWHQGDELTLYGTNKKYKGNLFLYMNRTPSGYTINNVEDLLIDNETSYNLYDDITMNAFALQIKDDGSIGYKYLIKNCDLPNNIEVVSGFSEKNIIKDHEWYTINVKIKCYDNLIKLFFYVNGKLKFISKELPNFNFRKLNEMYDKQEGVPFNISVGGGTQGLCDVILPKYLKIYDTSEYPLSKYFGGTFIGDIRSFRFYNGPIEYNNLLSNHLYDEKNNI